MGCTCRNHFPVDIDVVIEANCLAKLPSYLESRNCRHVLVVVDQNTYRAAGKSVLECLSENSFAHALVCLQPNEQEDVVADEVALVQIFMEASPDVDVFIAVGSGTIHDLVRFVSCKLQRPFVSIPTAPSVDGFASSGAPLVIRGAKVTIQAAPPVAIFADLNILQEAPRHLLAAGFGDMLGKCTALVDWTFSCLMADEPYCETAAEWTRQALDSCLSRVDAIVEGKAEGIEILMRGLIQSGLAMLLVGHSRSASGAEHHLSHYWETDFLEHGRPQVLHGAKVGVATGIISGLYKNLFEHLSPDDCSQLSPHYEALRDLVFQIPEPGLIKDYLRRVQGPALPEELGIDRMLVNEALHKAYRLRERYTILRFINENNLWNRLAQD